MTIEETTPTNRCGKARGQGCKKCMEISRSTDVIVWHVPTRRSAKNRASGRTLRRKIVARYTSCIPKNDGARRRRWGFIIT